MYSPSPMSPGLAWKCATQYRTIAPTSAKMTIDRMIRPQKISSIALPSTEMRSGNHPPPPIIGTMTVMTVVANAVAMNQPTSLPH